MAAPRPWPEEPPAWAAAALLGLPLATNKSKNLLFTHSQQPWWSRWPLGVNRNRYEGTFVSGKAALTAAGPEMTPLPQQGAAKAAALPSGAPCQHARWRCPPPLPGPKMAPAELCPHPSWPPPAGATAAPLPFPTRSQDGGGGGEAPCGERAVKPLPPPRPLQQ